MQSQFRKRGVMLAGLMALILAAALPQVAAAVPEPGAKRTRGFRLFARALGALTINRVYCGLTSDGQVCVDSTNSSTIGGGFWPKGTADQYVFNSGLQLAGVIGTDGGPWAGDTSGAFFFDPKGTTQHGDEVAPIHNTTNDADAAFIEAGGDPMALAARVPTNPAAGGDVTGDLFDPLLQGRTSASQGDVWWLSWDGNPALNAGRPHPLGIVVEQRGMGWNYPSGNEDIVYFIYTFYNVTSTTPGIYASVRPGMREILEQKSVEFQQRNNTSFGVTIPPGGYTITDLFAAFGADMDVGDAGENYASVNVPFALGYTYENTFSRFAGWTFDPAIFSAPFFAGTGFVGVKYLKSPEDPVTGDEVGLTLFGNTTNGGGFSDAQNTTQLFRYLSGNINTAAGDDACSFNPVATKICFIRQTSPFDMRFFQSSGPLTLGPGEFGSIVVAYIFAAPVATGSCPGASCDIKPGNPTIIAGLDDPAVVAGGVNPVDSISGFLDASDANTDGVLTQDEFTVVPGSLLGKAAVAQSIFNFKFLLPFSPEPPEFFLVPGDNQVTVLWRPSDTETLGDPFFQISSQPIIDGNPNPLYDPNYREFDVEGYRVYRGRVDAPNSLTLLAQFDYAGTVISDFAGQVNPDVLCAPELGITANCPVVFDPVVPGQARTVSNDVPLVGEIVQVKLGERTALAIGEAILLISDTALTGNDAGFPQLSDTGIPFVFVDNTPRNNFRYFYSVTAFDVNSWQSGPTNLESPRATKPVTPVRLAANYENTAVLDVGVYGRSGTKVPDIPTPSLDPATGTFGGPFPPMNGASLSLVAFVQQLIAAPGAVTARLDSLDMGSAYDAIPQTYYVTLTTAAGATELAIPITQDVFDATHSVDQTFIATNVDASLAARYGGNGSYELSGNLHIDLPGNYYTNSFGRGCVNNAPGFAGGSTEAGCDYNGVRWFDGPSPGNNETFAHPTQGNAQNGGGNPTTNFTNAGSLTGVANAHETRAYQTAVNVYREVEGALGAPVRAADFNVYWGAGGLVDSVIDVSNDVVVPFDATRMNASWGFLNAGDAAGAGSFDARAELTTTDFSCIEPLRSFAEPQSVLPCATAAPYTLSQTAVPGPIAFWSTDLANAADPIASPAAPNPGFGMYLSGHTFLFELEAGGTVPAAGTVWTMRSYTGIINGGGGCAECIAGDDGPYEFVEQVVFPFSAVGAEVRFTYDVVNQLNAPVDADLDDVHTVPDPYYVTSEFEQSTDTKIIKFVNLPQDAIIRIYSSSGVLVDLLEHHSTTFGGEETWDVRNRNNQVVASGVYFYHVEAGNARKVGRFTIVNFAQ